LDSSRALENEIMGVSGAKEVANKEYVRLVLEGVNFYEKIFSRDGWLTQRALDAGDSAHIPGSFLRFSLFPLGRGSPVRPSASNANRWALVIGKSLINDRESNDVSTR
jgi:hypothetical protein